MTVPHMLAGVIAGVPDGNEHIWTVDLDPKFNVIRKGRPEGYVIGGGGFSRALTSFTAPVKVPCGYYYDGYYGVGCTGTITIARTSTNQGNLDIGGEWRVFPYQREKLFLEARYLRLFSPNTGLPPRLQRQSDPCHQRNPLVALRRKRRAHINNSTARGRGGN